MAFSSDQQRQAAPLSPNAQRMLALRDHVLAEWSQRVRKTIKEAHSLPHPILTNTFPSLYENLAQTISPAYPRARADEGNTVAFEHGGERARLTHYNAQAVISEYQLLRWTIFDVLEQHGVELDSSEFLAINSSIDGSICDAVHAFELVQSSLRERFVAALTHDLRTPLGAALNAAELIKLGADAARTHSLAQLIADNLSRVDSMIRELLDVVVFQTGERLSLNLSHFDMESLAREVAEQFNTVHGSRIHLDTQPAPGHWDKGALRRAIENLVGNAVKYSTPDSPIHIRVACAHQRVMISVHNEGEPIPLEQRETVFQAFRRTREAKEGGKQGWGIGLPYVRTVVESHGGSLGVDSAADRGTTFALDMPLDARPYLNAPVVSGMPE